MPRLARTLGLTGAAAVLLAAGGGIATAGIAASRRPTRAVACVNRSDSLVLAQNGICGAGLTLISLPLTVRAGRRGQTGASGPAGPAGQAGAPGVAGPAGPPGAAGITTYAKAIAVPGPSSTAPATVTLATIGPFTLTGSCFVSTGTTVTAETLLTTSADHAAYDVIGYASVGDFNVATGPVLVGIGAKGSPGAPKIVAHEPMFIESPNGTVSVDLYDDVAVYLGSVANTGASACSWFGSYYTN